MATAISAKTNGPAANRFRSFSVNNKATKPHPAAPVPVIPVRVAPAVRAKVAPAVPVKAAEAVVPVVRGKVIAPDLAGPVRAVSLEALGDNLLATHWHQYSMQMAMV